MSILRDRLVERARWQTRDDHLPSNRDALTVRYRIGANELVVRHDRAGLSFPPADGTSADLIVTCERAAFEELMAGKADFMDYFACGRVRLKGDTQTVLYVAERNLLFELLSQETIPRADVVAELLK